MRNIRSWLTVLVIINMIASVLHFGDNMLFFHEYPEPSWISSPHIVDLLWLAATPLLLLGWWLNSRGSKWLSIATLIAYSLVSLLVLGHYLYAPPSELSLRINFFILFEAAAASALILFSLLVLTRAGASLQRAC